MLFTRGVLLDIAALKGVPDAGGHLPDHAADLQPAARAQKLTLQPGDAVLIHTGWGKLWGKDNARYTGSSPGIGMRRRRVARAAGSDAGRRRHRAGGDFAEPGPAAARCPCTRSCSW